MADGMERRGPAEGEDPDGGADAAERAFEALRAEVAELRGVLVALVERVPRPGRAVTTASAAVPDYSLTLGVIAQELKEIGDRLDDIEAHPALALTPEEHAQQVAEAVKQARDHAAGSARWASTELAKASGELKGIVGSAHSQFEQQGREWGALLIGAVLGFVLWWPLAWGLPWGLGDRLASTLVLGAGRWGAGQTLMREADPEAWGRMRRLYNACPADASTELCEAVMAVRTIPPGPPTQPVPGEAKPALPAAVPVLPPSRGKAGAGR